MMWFIKSSVYDGATNMLKMSFDGKIGNVIIKDIAISFNVAPGVMTPIPKIIDIKGVQMPTLFVGVLAKPSPDDAILAVGPREESKKLS